MNNISIRIANEADATKLNEALACLSNDLGDSHNVSSHDLVEHGFGHYPSFTALLAEQGDKLVGVALFSPVFSTTRGGSGAFISDLWVDGGVRGYGLGRRLLIGVANTAESLWGASFIKLSVYQSNPDARAAYRRLGFEALADETAMVLNGSSLNELRQP